MAMFDWFGKKSPEDIARKHASRIADKRGYAPDRWDSIRTLADLAHPEAAKVLLTRFTFRTDPGITDQEEKDLAFRGVVAAGEGAVPHIRAFLESAESATWPVKMLAALLPEDRVVEEILAVLAKLDASYAKDPQRKVQLLMELETRRDPRIAEEIVRFLADPSEQVRFHALSALAAQERSDSILETLRAHYETEESARLRAVVLDAFVTHGVGFPAETAQLARDKAPSDLSIAADGTVRKA